MLAPSSALLILVEARAENEDVRAEGWLSHLRSVKFSNDGHRLKMSLDETKWASIGVGLKFSGNWTENIDNNRYKDTFTVDFVRVFISGQVHKYVKFGVNAECTFCNNQSSGDIPKMAFRVLDAAAHFEINRYFNVWGGRMLVPTDRNEMSGPFYMATLDGFKTPFFSADYSLKHGVGGAGFYGRDDGGTFFGSVEPKFIPGTLQYTVGIFRGLRSSRKSNFGPNQNDHALYAWRVTYNFLNPEENPGYYTSDLYYGEAGDILALAFGGSYQKDGAGSAAHKSDFIGLVFDVLFEKVLPQNMGVFTAKGEYKRFFSDYNKAAFSDPDCFCIFDGQSWTATALYLFPTKVGIGRFQPYGRYTSIQPRGSSNREEIEGGVNYIIDTFSLRVGAFYQYGDLTTKGIENYAPGAMGPKIGVFKLAFQYQM
tara:strand:+ start:428 stop:1705 length:1278 start_codon:yes stop_codon:yes gene_type:complete